MFLADRRSPTCLLFPLKWGVAMWHMTGCRQQRIPLFCCAIRNKWTWQEAGRRKQKPKCQLQVSQFIFGVPFSECPKHHLFHLLQMCHVLANIPKKNTVCLRAFLCSSTNTLTVIKQRRSYSRHKAFESWLHQSWAHHWHELLVRWAVLMWRDMTAATAKMKEHGGCENPWDLFSIVVSNEQDNFIGNPHKTPLHWQMPGHASGPLSAQGDLSGKGTSSWELGTLPASIQPHSQEI